MTVTVMRWLLLLSVQLNLLLADDDDDRRGVVDGVKSEVWN